MSRNIPVCLLIAFSLSALAAHADATPLPAPVAAMIDAAAGDDAQLKAVSDIAKKTNPNSVTEINAKLASIHAATDKRRVQRLADQRMLQGWRGRGQIGGAMSTGNTKESGLTVSVDLKKESLRWNHDVNALFDYKSNNGVDTRNRYLAAYEGDYKIQNRVYGNLLFSWERDPFAGFSRRFSESSGLGYQFLPTSLMTLNLDVGLSARQTAQSDGSQENIIGSRVGARYKWKLSPATAFTEDASANVANNSKAIESTTALTTKLTGALSGQASLNVRYDSNPPPLTQSTDTATKVSLVYDF